MNESLIIILFFIFGTIIGSFLNVVILRFHTGMTLQGRSKCFACSKTLRWFELFPVFSFMAQRGKCLHCKSRISVQYPLVEVITGILFALSAVHFIHLIYFSIPFFLILTFYFIILFSLLMIIVVYDIRHKIIPNQFAYTFFIVSVIGLFLPTSLNSIYLGWYNICAGLIIGLPFALLWLISRGRWMGLGDPKLMLGMGTVLGLFQGLIAIAVSFWIAAIVGVILLAFKKANRKTEVPFAPFLAIGFAITVLFFTPMMHLFFSIYQ